MKIIHSFFSITFLVISLLLGQTVGLQAQTKGRNSGLDQTTFEIIKTRTAILEDFKKQRFDRVKVQCDSLRKEFENDNHLPFFPAEYWLLSFWTKDYTSILNDKYLSDTSQYNSTYISYPIFDNMGEEVRKETREQCADIKRQINSSSLSTKDKDFLQIVLLYSIHRSNEAKDTLQVTINEMTRSFIEKNPSSPNLAMMKGYIIKDYQGLKTANEIVFGGGYSVPFDKLGTYMSPGFNLAIDYRKYIGSCFWGLTGNMYSGKMIDSVDVNSKWMQKDEIFNVYYLGLDVGNRFVDTKRVSLSAFAGGAYNALTITHAINKTESEQVTINTFAGRVGLAFDFKFVKQGVFASFKNYSDYNHSKFFRLKYDYEIPMYTDKASALQGGIHNITFCIGFNTRDIIKK
jgi:hypothetical protein